MSFVLRCALRKSRIIPLCTVQQHRHLKRWLAPTLKELYRRQEQQDFLYGKTPTPKRSALLEWNFGSEVYAFGKRLGEEFDDALLRQAFTDKNYMLEITQEQEKVGIESVDARMVNSNEELGREGRELISQYVFGFLRHTYKNLPEEGVQSIHDELLSEVVLAAISKGLGTNDIILVPDQEPSQGTLSQVFCAIVGALSRSTTADRTGRFIRDFVLAQLAEKTISDFYMPKNPWVTLQSIYPKAEARLANVEGSGTILAAYRVAIFNKDKNFVGEGFGESVNIARNMAAVNVMNRMFEIHETGEPLPLNSKDCPKIEEIGLKMNNPNLSIKELTPNVVRLE